MRITSQLLRSKAKCSVHSIEYLDLSNLAIAFLEKLHQCPKLQTLIARGNAIEVVQNVEKCHQLWRLDLGNNKIYNLDGLSKFIALGELNLSNNDLTWAELMKIRHMHILHLSLHGKKKMEKDPYYRIHVIDSLPSVWMLDGRIITSAEKIQVQQFFQDSAMTERPVRHKLTMEQFVPTSMKKIQVEGIYGERTTHFMKRFPTSGSLNAETDRRRVEYLVENLQRELQLEAKYRKRIKLLRRPTTRTPASQTRGQGSMQCTAYILIASLEFALPTFLVQETLSAATISSLGNCDTIELFLMPRDHRCQVTALLLSAVKVDRDNKEVYSTMSSASVNSSSETPTRVMLISTPRSVSTAFTKCMSCIDGSLVFLEPYLVNGWFGKDKQFDNPFDGFIQFEDFADVAKDLEEANIDYGYDVTESSYSWCKSELEKEYPGKKLIFCKEIAHGLRNHYVDLPRGFRYVFLIRNTLLVFPSWKKTEQKVLRMTLDDMNLNKWTEAMIPKCKGSIYKEMCDQVEFIKKNRDPNPIVIDAEDLLRAPSKVLKTLFHELNIPYSDSILEWDSSDAVARNWVVSKSHMEVNKVAGMYREAVSSGKFFAPKQLPNLDNLTEDERQFAQDAMPYYEKLYERRIK